LKNRKEYFRLIHSYPHAFENPAEVNAGIHIATDPALINRIEAEMRGRLKDKNLPPQWAEVGVVYQDQYSTILRDGVCFQPGSKLGTYIRSFTPNEISGVAILPVYRQSVCMIKIFRHALRRWVLEIPRGFGEEDQTPLQNAVRELREEIGGTARAIHGLGYMRENSGMGNAKAALFYAELEDIGLVSEEEGIQEIALIPKKEFISMIKKGSLEDSFTLCAAMRAMLNGYLTL
jgi:ADP-ribose pyrophosphatase